MRKTLRILALSFALLLFALPVFAENTFDLKGMSTEDLLALQEAVNAEVFARNTTTKEVTVPPGTYIVGVDIPAADYSFRYDGSSFSSIDIEDANGRFVCGHNLSNGETVGKQPLKDGQIVEISYGSIVFMPYKGLGF